MRSRVSALLVVCVASHGWVRPALATNSTGEAKGLAEHVLVLMLEPGGKAADVGLFRRLNGEVQRIDHQRTSVEPSALPAVLKEHLNRQPLNGVAITSSHAGGADQRATVAERTRTALANKVPVATVSTGVAWALGTHLFPGQKVLEHPKRTRYYGAVAGGFGFRPGERAVRPIGQRR